MPRASTMPPEFPRIYARYGHNAHTTARVLGRPVQTVRNWALKMGLPTERKRRPVRVKTRTGPPENFADIWEQVDHKTSKAAMLVGRTPMTVRRWVAQLGLPKGRAVDSEWRARFGRRIDARIS